MTHYNPLFVTVLPPERRARHPYQLCVMLMLITLAISQMVLGPPSNSSVRVLPQDTQNLLNMFCLAAGIAGVAAALIPERIVRVFRCCEFDATWFRLGEELGSHLFLLTIWVSYIIAILNVASFAEGLSLGSAAAFWLAVAAAWRVIQIVATLRRAGVFNRNKPTAIVGTDTIDPVIDPDRRGGHAGG